MSVTKSENATRGYLKDVGMRPLGIYRRYRYFRCNTCGTDYPRINLFIMCNGRRITLCPYCTDLTAVGGGCDE
jgi:hypothetical protein